MFFRSLTTTLGTIYLVCHIYLHDFDYLKFLTYLSLVWCFLLISFIIIFVHSPGYTDPISWWKHFYPCPERHYSSSCSWRLHTPHTTSRSQHSNSATHANGTNRGHREESKGIWPAVLGWWRDYQHSGREKVFLGKVLLYSGMYVSEVWQIVKRWQQKQ